MKPKNQISTLMTLLLELKGLDVYVRFNQLFISIHSLGCIIYWYDCIAHLFVCQRNVFTLKMDFWLHRREHQGPHRLFDTCHSCQHHFDFVNRSDACLKEHEELDLKEHHAEQDVKFLQQPNYGSINKIGSCSFMFNLRL